MPDENDVAVATRETDAAASAREDAELESGFTDKRPPEKLDAKPAAKADAKPDPKAEPEALKDEAPPAPAEQPPEYVQISKRDWEEVRAAAARTASYDNQFSRAFGTIGNLQKTLNGLTTQPQGRRELPKEAFAEMERDFPELAAQIRGALEASLPAMSGGGTEPDPAKQEAMWASYLAKKELEKLDDAHPQWRQIVGAIDAPNEAPDPAHPFRRWLATKDETYQTRINKSESAAVIGRAIQRFQAETKGRPAPAAAGADPQAQARADRIRAAVQPRGDNAGGPPGKSDDDEFMAGFNSR